MAYFDPEQKESRVANRLEKKTARKERRADRGKAGASNWLQRTRTQAELDALKRKSEAEIRQEADFATTQAGQVAQAQAMELGQQAEGSGWSGQLMEAAGEGIESLGEVSRGAIADARALDHQVYMIEKNALEDRLTQGNQWKMNYDQQMLANIINMSVKGISAGGAAMGVGVA